MTFILIDFENTQPANLQLLNGGSFSIKVFVGANQAKLPIEMVQAIQRLGSSAEYIRIEGVGNNALDFHIAYYVGKLAAEVPGSSFFIISKDSGFDPLIKHLNKQKIACQRVVSLQELPTLRPKQSPPERDYPGLLIKHLQKAASSRPRTIKTLRSTVRALFQMAQEEAEKVVAVLERRGVIQVNEGKVTYLLPEPAVSPPQAFRGAVAPRLASARARRPSSSTEQPALF